MRRAVLLALSLTGSSLLVAGGAQAQDGDEAPVEGDSIEVEAGEAEDDGAGDAGVGVEDSDAGDASGDEAPAEDLTPPAEDEEPTVSPDGATLPEDDAEEATEAAAEDEEEEAAPAPSGPALTFTGSLFSWTNAVTANTFSQAAQLSYNPTYQMSFSLMPRFYLTDTTFLMLNQGLWLELTDTDGDTYNREPLLSDTLLDIRQSVSWEGFVFQFAGRLGFPLSKASQAANRILQTGLGLTVVRAFPEAANFSVVATAGYRRWWATTNVPTTGVQYPGFCPTAGDLQQSMCNQASGSTSARDILLAGLILSVVPYEGLTVSASGYYFTTYGHELAPAEVAVNGGTVTVPDESVTHWAPFTYFSLAVGYDIVPWLNLQLGIQNSGVVATLYNSDGSVRSPFSVDTQIYLSVTLGLDTIYNELVTTGEDVSPEEALRRRQGI